MNVQVFVSALLGSGVEFFEIVAIAYALASAGHAREALRGTVLGLLVVTVAALALGPRLSLVPLRPLQVVSGVILLWLGAKWTLKSVRRLATGGRAGWVQTPLRGEQAAALQAAGAGDRKFNHLSFVAMFKSTALETFEVALVVVILGLGSGAWTEALAGAVAALAATVAVVVALHGRLKWVPEVHMKLGAGLLLLTFGTFWFGEGVGLHWPGHDLAPLGLLAGYAALALAAVRWRRRGRAPGLVTPG